MTQERTRITYFSEVSVLVASTAEARVDVEAEVDAPEDLASTLDCFLHTMTTTNFFSSILYSLNGVSSFRIFPNTEKKIIVRETYANMILQLRKKLLQDNTCVYQSLVTNGIVASFGCFNFLFQLLYL